jgi:hypothetical protein
MLECPKCKEQFELDKVLESQLTDRILSETNEKHKAEIDAAVKEVKESLEKQIEVKQQIAIDKAIQEKELAIEKLKADVERDKQKEQNKQALLIEQLQEDSKSAKEENKELREQLTELTKTLREEKKTRENAELEAQKKLNNEADKIREEAKKEAIESQRYKEAELEKQLANTKQALDVALRKAEQGSEQIQGEVLELEVENTLRTGFPQDLVEEVKKGVYGADTTQIVRNNRFEDCGLMLWEMKNTTNWNKEWVAKMKDNMRSANANIGIIVSRVIPEEYGEMYNIEGSVWVVKPKLVYAIASALRTALIQVYSASRNSENRDEKMEFLYKFLTGTQFKHRIEAIVDNYKTLQDEIDKEKKQAYKRWGKQEKSIAFIVENTFGLYGDLQGITGEELQIPLLEMSEVGEE